MNICDCVNYPHKTAKPIGGDFNAEYVRQHKNHQIGAGKLHFKVLTFEKPIECRAIAVLQCVYTYKRDVRRMENLLSFTFNMDSNPEEDLEAVNEY